MSTKSFKLQDILPNPFRRIAKYPLQKDKIERLMGSIEANSFWANTLILRINTDGEPEAAFGHHRLAAARQIFPGTKVFEWTVEKLTDGQMIQHMASENSDSYKTDPSVMRETIQAAVEALGAGKILPSEMPIDPRTDPKYIKYAPGFGTAAAAAAVRSHPYTVEALAKFLGELDSRKEPTKAFRTAFTSLELIKEGRLNEETLRGVAPWRVTEVVRAARAERDVAVKNAERAAQEIEKKKQEVAQQAELARKRQEAAAIAEAARREAYNKEASTQREKAEAKKKEEAAKAAAKAAEEAAAKKQKEADKLAERAKKELEESKARSKANADDFVQHLESRQRDELRAARARAKEAEEDAKAKKRVVEETADEEDDYDEDVEGTLKQHREAQRLEVKRREEQKQKLLQILKEARAIVKAGKKKVAEMAHPDHGGTQEWMQDVNAAAQWLLQQISQEEELKSK